ncbi:MAG: TonB-dependent receptor [Candidatus Kapabacteria bacterium]|nr:TonB-dependent receptor [Candidatus Kapabacteria bacterium]
MSLTTSAGYYDRDNFRYFNKQKQLNLYSKIGYQVSDNFSFNLSGNATIVSYDDWVFWRSLSQPFLPPLGSDSITLNSDKYNIMFDGKYLFDENNFLIIKSGAFFTSMTNNLSLDNTEVRKSDALSLNNDFQFSSKLDKTFFLTYGFNIANNKVRSITFKDHDQSIFSFYTQGEYSGIDKLNITFGARLDKEQTDAISSKLVVSPKLGLSYKPSNKLNLRASVGAGFRAPVIAERFSSVKFLGFLVRPDSTLRPEKSTSYEIGTNYEFKILNTPIYLDLALFQNDLIDLIDPDFPDKTKAEVQFRNITKARIRGLEINIKTFLFDFLGLETGLTAMEPRDLDLNQTLKYRSKFVWTNKLLLPLSNNLQVQADYRFKARNETIDDRLAFGIKDTEARVDVHVVDLRLIYKAQNDFNMPISFIFSCNNLLNYYYTELVGNMASTRFLNLQIDYKLN